MSAGRPNILFILADDLGWRDLGCYGSSFHETPHLDRLAGQGMVFTDAYAACPVCSPTRASILTGRYPARVGVTDFIDWGGRTHPLKGRLVDAPYIRHLPLEEKSLASALGAGGYAPWHVGKWHLGGEEFYPQRHGFEVNVGGCMIGGPWKGYFAPWQLPGLEEGPDGAYLDDHLTNRAVELIRRGGGGRPFFLNMCFYLVHTPLAAPGHLVEKYRRKAGALGLDSKEALKAGEFYPFERRRDKRIVRRLFQSNPVYAAMVEAMDRNVGRLLHALEETGQAENTIVVFTSDNGGLSTTDQAPTCNAPLLEGKGWTYEGGTRVPLLVRWPGRVRPGARCAAPVTSPDFYPTLLAAAGLPALPGQRCDGANLVPLLEGGPALDREAIFWHYPHYGNCGGTPACAVRSGDWKLIEFFEDDRVELYQLRDDPGEGRNLAGSEPATAERLRGLLHAWLDDCSARIPEVNPNWESFDRFGGGPQ